VPPPATELMPPAKKAAVMAINRCVREIVMLSFTLPRLHFSR
jgi:hypothetical protein